MSLWPISTNIFNIPPTTMNIILATAIILLYRTVRGNGSHFMLHRKQKTDSTPTRRRLSFLMDSFVDPSISDDYFYAVLYVGSPLSQRVEMALDTGSGLPYFACKETCTHCGKHDDLPFIITNSTSFEWIPCGHGLCGGGRCKKIGGDSVCEWSQRYVDKSSISAAVGSDVISFYKYPHLPLADYRQSYRQIMRTAKESVNAEAKAAAKAALQMQNGTESSKTESNSISGAVSKPTFSGRPQLRTPLEMEKKLRLVFGCSESEANTIFRQGADGVMGLSMHHRSFVDQLFSSNKNRNDMDLGSKQFAHCFGATTGGLLMFGSVEIQDLTQKFNIKPVWINLLSGGGGHGWYRVKTVGFSVEYTDSTLAAMAAKTKEQIKGNDGNPPNQQIAGTESAGSESTGTQSAGTQSTESQSKFNEKLNLDATADPVTVQYVSSIKSGYHGSVLDTGSSTLSMPRRPSKEIMAGILKLVNAKIGNGSLFAWTADKTKNYDFFLMVEGRALFSKEEFDRIHAQYLRFFPDLIMFWNGDGANANKEPLRFSVPVDRYLLFKSNRICLDLFGDTPSLLIGSNVMVNKLIIYDRDQMRLGVADIDCDHLLIDNVPTEKEGQKETVKEGGTETVPVTNPAVNPVIKPVAVPVPEIKPIITSKITESHSNSKGIFSPTALNPPRQSPVVFIHLENHKMYWLYFVAVMILAVCIGCAHRLLQKRRHQNTKNRGRYERVNRDEPEDDQDGDGRIESAHDLSYRRQNGHRRRRRAMNDEPLDHGHVAVQLDNILARTTPTASFTSSLNPTLTASHHGTGSGDENGI